MSPEIHLTPHEGPESNPQDDAVPWSFVSSLDEMMHYSQVAERRRRSHDFRRIVDHLWPNGHPTSFIQVIGTNGKGTTTRFCEAALVAADYSAGSIISPHVIDVRERWSVNKAEVDPALLAYLWSEKALRVLDKFELVFGFHDLCLLVGLLAFDELGVRWGVVEAGIGAAYDRTTALDRSAVVITNVGDDHGGVLGPLRWQREFNKSRGAVAGVPLVLGQPLPAAMWADLAPQPDVRLVAAGDTVARVGLNGVRGHLGTLAATVLDMLGLVEFEEAVSAMVDVHLPGRWHFLQRDLVVDMAHDAHAMAALVEMLVADGTVWSTTGSKWTALVALSADRDAVDVFSPLIPHCAHIVTTKAAPDGAEPGQLADALRSITGPNSVSVSSADDPLEAIAVLQSGAGPRVICGSSRLAGLALGCRDYRLRDTDSTFGWRSQKRS